MAYQTHQDMALAIAKGGEVSGYELVQKFGTNEAVGTSYVPVASGGVYQTPMSTGAIAVRIKAGGNANDTAAGTGAREVTIYGLDENFEEVSEAIATAGALASSSTTTTFTRIYRARVTASGTYATSAAGSHSAAITIEDASANIWAVVPFDGFPYSTTEIASYSVAAGEVAYLLHIDTYTDSTKTTEILFFVREDADGAAAPYSPMRVLAHFHQKGGEDSRMYTHAPIKITGPADMGFMAKVDTGTATVSAGFELVIQHANAV